MFHAANRMPDEKGTDGSDDGGGGVETDGQSGSTSFPSVLVRRTYFGRHISENKTKLSVYSGPVGWQRLALKEEKHGCTINMYTWEWP